MRLCIKLMSTSELLLYSVVNVLRLSYCCLCILHLRSVNLIVLTPSFSSKQYGTKSKHREMLKLTSQFSRSTTLYRFLCIFRSKSIEYISEATHTYIFFQRGSCHMLLCCESTQCQPMRIPRSHWADNCRSYKLASVFITENV